MAADPAFTDGFYREFEERRPLYTMALSRTCDALQSLTRDKKLFTVSEQRRVRVEQGRIKDANRLLVKAQSERYDGQLHSPEDIFKVITDIAGTRVTCNTIEDVRRFESALIGAQHLQLLSTVESRKSHEDYIVAPKPSGYRALHFLVEMPVPHGADTVSIPCEIQIRTLLQHAWGELTHEDTFKPEVRVPPLVSSLSKRLATALAVLDEIAQDLRDELNKIEKESVAEAVQATAAPKPKPKLQTSRIREIFLAVTGRELVLDEALLRDALASVQMPESELRQRIVEADRDARAIFDEQGVLLGDADLLRAACNPEGSRLRLDALVREQVAKEEADAVFLTQFAQGAVLLGTLIRVANRYAIVQFQDGGQGILSARHYEEGRTRVNLQDVLQPGETVRVEVVNADLGTRRVEVRPR